MSMKSRSVWGTRFGFYFAAIGTAFGLGNLWRFPYVVAENGGGAFVLLYIFFALLIGLPLLISELMLGKLTRMSAISAVKRVIYDPALSSASITPGTAGLQRLWLWFGRLTVFASLCVLSYYAVISGWVLHFLMQFLFGEIQGIPFDAEKSLLILRENGLLQVALASVHLLATVVVVVKGVQKGIEKWVGYMTPVFVILLLLLVTKALSLPTATSALRFLFYPDFSKLTSSSLVQALGHVFFTLSIGFGTMITFGSYLQEGTHIPSAGFRVTSLDTFISLFAGLLVFPIVVGASFTVSGPEVLFQTLPRLLGGMEGGAVFGIAFFLCLYLAALGASIGLLEGVVSNWLDFTTLSRSRATWLTGGVAFILAVFPALSTSVLREVSYQGRGLLEILDAILINGVLPLIAFGISLAVSIKIKEAHKRAEFINEDSLASVKLYSHWKFVIRWVAPLVIAGALLLELVGLVL